MGIVARTIPDHIRIQFGTGQPHHTEADPPVGLGELAGAHYVEIEYLVDEATGAVVGQTNNKLNGVAQVLPLDKVQEILGKSFTDFDEQIRTLTAAIAEQRAIAAAVRKESGEALAALRVEAQSAIDALTAERDAWIARAKAAAQALGAAI